MWSHCYWDRWPHHDARSTWFAISGRHRFAVPVLVLWAGLRKSRELNLDGEKNLLGHLQSSAGDARMQMQVETSVGWFSLFKWEPSRFSFWFSERESEFSHREMTCPSIFSHWKPTFWKPLKVSVESLVEVGLYIWSGHYARKDVSFQALLTKKKGCSGRLFRVVTGFFCWPFSFVTFCYFFLLLVTFVNYFLLLKVHCLLPFYYL